MRPIPFKTFYQIKVNGFNQFLSLNYRLHNLLSHLSNISSRKLNSHKVIKKISKKSMLFTPSHLFGDLVHPYKENIILTSKLCSEQKYHQLFICQKLKLFLTFLSIMITSLHSQVGKQKLVNFNTKNKCLSMNWLFQQLILKNVSIWCKSYWKLISH